MLMNERLIDFVEATASGEPTPGGGSVSALAGALGGALSVMVYNLTTNKKSYDDFDDEVKKQIEESCSELVKLKENLLKSVDLDATAFDAVMAAFKLPKDTEEQKKHRQEAIEEGYLHAISVPLDCANLSLDVLKCQKVLAKHGNINATSDIGVGALLACTACEGSLLNVKINAYSLKNQDKKEELLKVSAEIQSEAELLRDEILKTVEMRMAK